MPARRYSYVTNGGVTIEAARAAIPYATATDALTARLDRRRGALFSSSFDFPGRYTRWDIGFADPPLAITARDRLVTIEALNPRGRVLLPAIRAVLADRPFVAALAEDDPSITLRLVEPGEPAAEEERSRLPSLFSVMRTVSDLFASGCDPHLGLYGAFGYDLAMQFEPFAKRLARAADQRDAVLYLPDRLIVVDHVRREARLHRYEFAFAGRSTRGLAKATAPSPYGGGDPGPACDHEPGEYEATVETARDAFARGDLFEVVLGQLFAAPCADRPSAVFRRLRAANPAPYGALLNLGEGEFLVAASPEMFVRVHGRRVETCPLSGTVARGADAFEDAERVRELLNSAKDESELTMCTDVDRNDKARICEPGSVKVIGRRQIETYSRLFHTGDHVEGMLRPGFDALDAFLTHAWAVTVTGAPKRWAMKFIEGIEKSPRRWYGGAIGYLGFDGNLNTGLTLRTIRLKDGRGEVRAGATLLHDSDPAAEDAEARLKASAMLAALAPRPGATPGLPATATRPGEGKRLLLVDHEDSFVHNLADYFRQTGAAVTTVRHSLARVALADAPPDLLLLSPGPGRPAEFAMSALIAEALATGLPIFGVCLGLQGLVEHFGGALGQLDRPVHGKDSVVTMTASRSFPVEPARFRVGRYHSLYARRIPDCLDVVGWSEEGVPMAIEHRVLPIAAVQFHPESILTARGGLGLALVRHAVAALTGRIPAMA